MRESEKETEEERDKVFGFGDTIIKQRGERERERYKRKEGGNFSREKRGRHYVEQVTAAAVFAVRVRPSVLHYL